MRYGLLTVGALMLAAGCASTAPPSSTVDFLTAPGAANELPFSEAVRAGNTLYLSGQIGVAPGTLELVGGGIAAETEQTLQNIRATLERHGSSLDDVVKCTVFLADIDDYAAMNAVYRTFFTAPYPARSTVAGSGLALGASVEIECIAIVE